MNNAVAPPACQTTLGLVVEYWTTMGPMARPRKSPTPMSNATLAPGEDRRVKFIANRQPNPARNHAMDHPGDRSRPEKAPSAKKPVVAATSHITWLNRARL